MIITLQMNTNFIYAMTCGLSIICVMISITVLMQLYRLIKDVGKQIDTTTIKQMALIQFGCTLEVLCIGGLSIFELCMRNSQASTIAAAVQLPFFMVGFYLHFVVLYHYIYQVSDRSGIRIKSVPLSCVTSPTSKLSYWKTFYSFYLVCVVVALAASEVAMFVDNVVTTAIQLVCVEGTNFLIGFYLIRSAIQFHRDSSYNNRYGSTLQLVSTVVAVIQLLTCFCGKATSLSFKISGKTCPVEAINGISGVVFSFCYVVTSFVCGLLTIEIRDTLTQKDVEYSSLPQK